MAASSSNPDLRGKAIAAFSLPPEDFTLVTDPSHPLYDEGVLLPIKEWMVANIMTYGVLEPIVVRRDGNRLEVVNGRMRVRCAVEANKRLRSNGFPTIKVPFIFRTAAHDKDMVGAVISENEIRRVDDALIKASKAQRMLHHGATLDEIAVAFGVVKETVENWLKLFDLHPKIIDLVRKGALKHTVAMRLARLPRTKQVRKLKQLRKAGATNANAVRVVVNGKLERVKPPTKQQLRRTADAFVQAKSFQASDAASDCYSFVAWALGRISTDELLDCLTSADSGVIAAAVKRGMLK